jgi:hypothetical protein
LKDEQQKPTTKQAMKDAATNQTHHGMRADDMLLVMPLQTLIIVLQS